MKATYIRSKAIKLSEDNIHQKQDNQAKSEIVTFFNFTKYGMDCHSCVKLVFRETFFKIS